MLMLPYRYCEDEAADLRIQQNINLLIVRMLAHQMDTACSYHNIAGYKELAKPSNTSTFYKQISGLFPAWVGAEDAVDQFILFYATALSRRFYKFYLLQEYLLDKLISESVYLAKEILVEGEYFFQIPFSRRDREVVGNALAEEYVETVANLYQSLRNKRKGEKYLIYSAVPYPADKMEIYENIFCLKDICFFSETYTMLETFDPSQLTAIDPSKAGLIEPSMKVPDAWWDRGHDICDISENPPGAERPDIDVYLPYMHIE